jgi:hypothetical protein
LENKKEFMDALTLIINNAYFLKDAVDRIYAAAKILEQYELGKKEIPNGT